MQILIRSINTKISDDHKRYLRKKILKYEMLIPNSSVIECTFEQKGGSRRDGNKIIHITASLPGTKKRIFAKSKAAPEFDIAIDVAEAKFKKIIQKYLDLKKYNGKRAKYYWSKIKYASQKMPHIKKASYKIPKFHFSLRRKKKTKGE